MNEERIQSVLRRIKMKKLNAGIYSDVQTRHVYYGRGSYTQEEFAAKRQQSIQIVGDNLMACFADMRFKANREKREAARRFFDAIGGIE